MSVVTTVSLEVIREYYDERVEGKLRDFTESNPRIEAAVETIAEWAPSEPKRVLEIGCGVGATSWRMAGAWPLSEVVGVDISALSIEVAQTCFKRSNLTFCVGLIEELALNGKFDLVVLMDVYEHIPARERRTFNATIKALLSEESRIILTVPTPAILRYIVERESYGLQPVDEDITIDEILNFARETETEHLLYRRVGIWRYGDYAHHVFGRYKELADVALRELVPNIGRKHRLRRLVGLEKPQGRMDYLGTDLCRPAPRDPAVRFRVSDAERRRRVAAWFRHRKATRTSDHC